MKKSKEKYRASSEESEIEATFEAEESRNAPQNSMPQVPRNNVSRQRNRMRVYSDEDEIEEEEKKMQPEP